MRSLEIYQKGEIMSKAIDLLREVNRMMTDYPLCVPIFKRHLQKSIKDFLKENKKPEFDWMAVPFGYNYIAIDGSTYSMYAYAKSPDNNAHTGFEVWSSDPYSLVDIRKFLKNQAAIDWYMTVDWKDSLIKRPNM